MFLGLDISTSILGYTLMNQTGQVLVCDHIDLKKYNNAFLKAEKVQEVLDNLFKTYRF